MSTEVLDLFCEWFEGRFENWTQASSNPTKWAHIFVTHEKIGDRKFRTSNRYNYQPDKPYREQEVEVTAPWVLGATEDIPPQEKTLELVAADDNEASQSVEFEVLPEEESQESELEDFFELDDLVVLDLPESPPPFSLLPAKQFC